MRFISILLLVGVFSLADADAQAPGVTKESWCATVGQFTEDMVAVRDHGAPMGAVIQMNADLMAGKVPAPLISSLSELIVHIYANPGMDAQEIRTYVVEGCYQGWEQMRLDL